MSPPEVRATIALAAVYGLRMFGMFVILPVFAIYAQQLRGGDDVTMVGIAIGAYGLTQAVLQIPAGWMSDRYGRKPIIYAGLVIFALGSFVAASADNIYWVIAGRAIQGAGAIRTNPSPLQAGLGKYQNLAGGRHIEHIQQCLQCLFVTAGKCQFA